MREKIEMERNFNKEYQNLQNDFNHQFNKLKDENLSLNNEITKQKNVSLQKVSFNEYYHFNSKLSVYLIIYLI